VRRHTEADFTHGICPNCLRKHFPDAHEQRYGSKAA
jgi:hypothetical protein